MKTSRYATSRQKACQQCVRAKARCDRREGDCIRCSQRGISCHYPQELSPATTAAIARCNSRSTTTTTASSPASKPGTFSHAPNHSSPFPERESSSGHAPGPVFPGPSTALQTFDFTHLGLVCPINADDISCRWLNPYIPAPGQIVKTYSPNVRAFLFRILKSYTTLAVRGRGAPPFVHWSQLAASVPANLLLTTCLSLVRICDKPYPGTEGTATEILQKEMCAIFQSRGTAAAAAAAAAAADDDHDDKDDLTLLAAFQASLLYAMVLFFQLAQGPTAFLRQAMIDLQGLACSSSRRGLVCPDQHRLRPRWEAWIVAEAKRRTLYTMYLFDSLLASEDGLQTFLGTELSGLPAPSSKSLWHAQERQGWEAGYSIYLEDWMEGGGLSIDELWPIPASLDEYGIMSRRNRVDSWLGDLDEFGTMLYAVTSCTHGS